MGPPLGGWLPRGEPLSNTTLAPDGTLMAWLPVCATLLIRNSPPATVPSESYSCSWYAALLGSDTVTRLESAICWPAVAFGTLLTLKVGAGTVTENCCQPLALPLLWISCVPNAT